MKSKTLFVIAAIVVGGALMGAVSSLHPFGVPTAEGVAVDEHYLTHAGTDLSCENVVTSIVFDYRGFDTIGESSVLFTALLSVMMLFRKGGRKE
ncbi:MAG: hypothetical protein J6D22_04190 [Pyramidobacter sp.]|jgi:multisubunit Na+/H+ antiporter MnhB subunit|nr:hypothetical protein [Pyramidobacter sp.]MBP3752300.1 hypothetical protein [Pyramidobacter sp.]MBP3835674.1 hypothetical protein [Pyramidobacter sp.]MBP3848931.1 hypothetical protein [Pyramidobacter sp.]MBQ4491254.1 hypothetical protein [Pyramidobacter sp.]